MAEDVASEPHHVCSCGISFGSILDPPDDNATIHTLTDACGPLGIHKDWAPAKTIKRRIDFESCIESDWGPGNIFNPEPLDLCKDWTLAERRKRSLDWDPEIECDCGCTKPWSAPPPPPSNKKLESPNLADLSHAKPGFDATDGCFSDVGFKIIKAATVVLLQHLIGKKLKDECEGCEIDHPSQLQHSCLFDPPNYYFDTHFDELSTKLFRPYFHAIIGILLGRLGLKSHPQRIQGTVGTILHELKDEPFIAAKLEEIRTRLLDKPCEEIVHDVVDLWEGISIVNGE